MHMHNRLCCDGLTITTNDVPARIVVMFLQNGQFSQNYDRMTAQYCGRNGCRAGDGGDPTWNSARPLAQNKWSWRGITIRWPLSPAANAGAGHWTLGGLNLNINTVLSKHYNWRLPSNAFRLDSYVKRDFVDMHKHPDIRWRKLYDNIEMDS